MHLETVIRSANILAQNPYDKIILSFFAKLQSDLPLIEKENNTITNFRTIEQITKSKEDKRDKYLLTSTASSSNLLPTPATKLSRDNSHLKGNNAKRLMER